MIEIDHLSTFMLQIFYPGCHCSFNFRVATCCSPGSCLFGDWEVDLEGKGVGRKRKGDL